MTGGAIYFGCEIINSEDCTLKFQGNICKKNVAAVDETLEIEYTQAKEGAGGCFYTDLFEVEGYLDNIYEENEAKYGANYGSYPHKAVRLTSNDPST